MRYMPKADAKSPLSRNPVESDPFYPSTRAARLSPKTSHDASTVIELDEDSTTEALVHPLWLFTNRNVLRSIPQALSLMFRFRFFRQLDSKLVTFAIDRGRNKAEFVAKVQLHQNRVQCSFVL